MDEREREIRGRTEFYPGWADRVYLLSLLDKERERNVRLEKELEEARKRTILHGDLELDGQN
jgi:hypothetical protein